MTKALSYLCFFEWTPSQRKKNGYPVIRDFISHMGLALMVMPPFKESWEQKKYSYLKGQFNPNTT